MTRKALLALVAGFTVLAAGASPAAAIPAFARKYHASCSLCHAAAPKLNAFGEQFAANGFQMAPGEEPRDTIDTGDSLLRLAAGLPLAVRMDAFAQLRTDVPEGANAFDLQTPWGIKLLSGGQLADNISYYMYFFMTERGEITGLEDAFVQFTDLAKTGVNLVVGQFQVSDPLFKRELRLPVEDYQLYRVRVGDARADLTYERGLMATWSPWDGGDLTLELLNGAGLNLANEERVYDTDNLKNFAGRFSQEVGPVRVGAFGYFGTHDTPAAADQIIMYGPDATLPLGALGELNAQYLRRVDDDPFFMGEDVAQDVTVDAAMAELVFWPQGQTGRLFVTGLFNWIRSDDPVFSLRLGEEAPLDRYTYGAANVSWLLRRNLRLMGETGWDFDNDRAKLTFGLMAAF